MIKLVIFDLDGVLIDTADMHFEALNNALRQIAGEKYVIDYEEHIAKFNGIPTLRKLEILTQERGLSSILYSDICRAKQKSTIDWINQNIYPSNEIIDTITNMFALSLLCVCSNSVDETVKTSLSRLKIDSYFYLTLSNEDTRYPKPNPSLYLMAMSMLGVSPKETVILEDSPIGLKAAYDSCAHVIKIESPKDINSSLIEKIKDIE